MSVMRLLERSPRSRARGRRGAAPTAVVAANDLIALGALHALIAQVFRFRRQVSLVGHNDMPLLDQ